MPSIHIIAIPLPQPQLHRIQRHRTREVDPSADIASAFATLARPPFARVIAGCGGEVLHQQTRVDGDEDGWAEVTEQSHERVDAF